MRLIIPGNVPSQKNGKNIRINQRTGKAFITSNDRVLIWKRMAVIELKQQSRGFVIGSTGGLSVKLRFYFDNKRRHDLDNAAAGVMDALVSADILPDDSVAYVDNLILVYGGIDKTNPRVEILI